MKTTYCESFRSPHFSYSTLTWDARGIVPFSMSHNTNRKTRQQWLIHTMGTSFLFSHTFFLSPLPLLDRMLQMVFSLGSALLHLNFSCVSVSMLVCLQYPVSSLYIFALSCTYLQCKKSRMDQRISWSLVYFNHLATRYYFVVQGYSATCYTYIEFFSSQKPKQSLQKVILLTSIPLDRNEILLGDNHLLVSVNGMRVW